MSERRRLRRHEDAVPAETVPPANREPVDAQRACRYTTARRLPRERHGRLQQRPRRRGAETNAEFYTAAGGEAAFVVTTSSRSAS